MTVNPAHSSFQRRFELPGVHELSKEQEEAIALSKQGNHLIIGGPGTGKTIVALLRARRHARDKDAYLFLVHNRMLNRSSKLLFNDHLESYTWLQWISREVFLNLFGQVSNFKPDWNAAFQKIKENEKVLIDNKIHIIVDEGQDMPPEFYRFLLRVGFENVFVVADQNQQIVPESNSSRSEIELELGLELNKTIELTTNYRNSYPTARLAREFYTGDPASPPPTLPPESRSSRAPLLMRYTSESFDQIIKNILKFWDREPRKLIGIITMKNETRERYLKNLNTIDVKLDHPRPKIQTYKYGEPISSVDFKCGGIIVINKSSCKGLEFDHTIIADINDYYSRDFDKLKKDFYVMVSRAKERVILLKRGNEQCMVDRIIPEWLLNQLKEQSVEKEN